MWKNEIHPSNGAQPSSHFPCITIFKERLNFFKIIALKRRSSLR